MSATSIHTLSDMLRSFFCFHAFTRPALRTWRSSSSACACRARSTLPILFMVLDKEGSSNAELSNPLAVYRKRWGIECLFAHAKKRGFNCADTHMTHPVKLHTLLAMAAVAMAWSYAIEWKKGHRSAISTMPRGWATHLLFQARAAMVAGRYLQPEKTHLQAMEEYPIPATRKAENNKRRVV